MSERHDGETELKHLLTHRDQSQLWFQLAEIVNDRTYLRHGVEVGPGSMVVDAGANVGVASAFFLHECGVDEVLSFEPVPEVHEMLEANLKQFPGARLFLEGLSDEDGEAELTYYEGAAAMSSQYADPERDRRMVESVLETMGVSEEEARRRTEGDFEPRTVTCRMVTFSTVVERERIESVDLLKIDVERAELDVLRGIRDEHWPMIRQIVAEVHDESGRIGTIQGLLEDHGFNVVVDQESNMETTGVFMIYATR